MENSHGSSSCAIIRSLCCYVSRIVSVANVDRLSNLPENVIEIILMHLPMEEAVRTSVLSKSWRYRWSTLPQIVIDDESLSLTRYLRWREWDSQIKAIDHILLLHQGPINYFKLSTYMEPYHGIDRWILFLSRNGIRELIIEGWLGKLHSLPSCLFSCVNLTRLKLCGCSLISPPTSFKGFSRLRVLDLRDITFTADCLNRILSGCMHLLEELIVTDLTCFPHLEISAPKLVNLEIQGKVEDLHLKNTPCLTTASIGLERSNSWAAKRVNCRIDKVFDNTRSIQKLQLLDYTLEILSVGYIPVLLPGVRLVKDLLIRMNFEDLKEMQAAFCIFRNSFFMEKLEITVNSNRHYARILADSFWEEEKNFNCIFDCLRIVKVTGFLGITSELKFIEFIFANAPDLEKLHVEFKYMGGEEDKKLQIIRELVQFRRISPKAELIISG